VKLPGWCEKCKRFRYVTVSHSGLVMLASGSGVAAGVCDECANPKPEVERRQGGVR
jgi:hypothetical protein